MSCSTRPLSNVDLSTLMTVLHAGTVIATLKGSTVVDSQSHGLRGFSGHGFVLAGLPFPEFDAGSRQSRH